MEARTRAGQVAQYQYWVGRTDEEDDRHRQAVEEWKEGGQNSVIILADFFIIFLQNLLDVNEEFASEVEKLYKNEEKYQYKIEHLERQYKDLQSKYQLEKQSQSNNLVGEQAKLEMQIKKLTNSLENMKTDYEQLLESNKQQERLLSNKQEVTLDWYFFFHFYDNILQDLLTNQEKDLNRLQKLLHIAQTDLEQERRLKEAGDSQIRMLTTELRRTEDEIKDIRLDAQENEKMKKIREQNEKLTAENFEYAVENVSSKNICLFRS